jgi:regulator of protease activity HflC (stomatin/prohibitin superfamily)
MRRAVSYGRVPAMAKTGLKEGIALGSGTVRWLSSNFSMLDLDDDLDAWPRSQQNTVLNICPQGEMMVVERLGKMHSIHTGGYFFAIPFMDQIRFCIDMREKALPIMPQAAITKDNVHVKVSGNIYCQFINAEMAAYGSKNPIYAVKQHAMASMRAAIGEMELDEILHARKKLNTIIKSTVQEAATAWGLEIKRYEITEISPDRFITEAMDKQAAAERDRRKKVLEAEGDKTAKELESQGEKIMMQNISEGEKIRIVNEAVANKERRMMEAEAEALAIQIKAKAQADAIREIAQTLSSTEATDAAKLNIAQRYIEMYSDIGQKSNTMIFNDRPADINALMAQASAVMNIDKTKK